MVAKIKSIVWGVFSVPVMLILAACSSSHEAPMLSRFEPTTCKHALADDSTTQCGYLIVPEDRSAPDNGKTLKLYVAIYKSLDGSSDNAPIIYLTGGPGASTAQAYGIFEETNLYIRQNFGGARDIVVLDQRGTNYSTPSLYCSEELGPLRSTVYGLSYRDAAALRIAAFEDCYSRLEAEDVNLSAYDSLENATDVRDVAMILGFETFNIYGASYGTRLAMKTMAHYPERIASVVLDSILPPEVNPFEQATPGILYAFQTFFAAARVQYPDLETQFYDMMSALQNAPVAVTGHHRDASGTTEHTVTVSGDKLAAYLVAKLKETPYDRGLPKTISAMVASGDYGAVADAWISNMDFFFPAGGPGSDAPSVAMYNAIFSADDAYYTSPQKVAQVIDNQKDLHAALAEYLRVSYIYMEPGVLGLWPVAPLPFRESDPLVSDIPTLMLVGTLDTATPEIFSQPSAALLSNSVYFAIPAGHAAAYLPCVTQMIDDFVKNPRQIPDYACEAGYQWE
ncbi:MAG: hypothetical protein VR64_19130 [Desulfatitalea sp. BRH_c12]|nr:MAG: hypothetical protein VR64_19130 [Desulfatitalea sp. BRH_c12]